MKIESLKTNKILSKRDATQLLDILFVSFHCFSKLDFEKLICSMRTILPFDSAACLIGWKTDEKKFSHYELFNVSYPDEWLSNYKMKNYHLIDPIVKRNFDNQFSLQYWKDTYSKYCTPDHFIKEAEDYNLRKGYSIGQTNLAGSEGSLFSFAGSSIEHNDRTEIILRHCAPHLHIAFNRLFLKKVPATPTLLTRREKEILIWVKEGKSSWEISKILNISEDTVNFHLKNTCVKLNATSRTHSVVIALERGVIEF